MSRTKGQLYVDNVGYALVDRQQVNLDPVAAHADAVREAVRSMPQPQCLLVGALPGQTAVVRNPRLPDMPFSQINDAIEAQAAQNIPYDRSEVNLDWSLLDTVTDGDEKMLRILLVAARDTVIDSRVQIAEAAELQYDILTVDSLSLADAAESCDFLRTGESVALVDIGLTSSSIHFTKDGVSNFIREVTWGAREFIQSIAKMNRCEYEEAEQILHQLAEDQGGADEAGLEEPSFEEEPLMGEEPAADLGELETPPLETFDSPLDPLEDEFADMDAVAEGPGSAGLGGAEPEKDIGEALGLALGRLVSEIRRSFDYYEHQLYERPVSRIILCGGVAHLNLIRENLMEELGVEAIEVADPTNSALFFGDGAGIDQLRERPAQFMVAVGLAARGMADL